jgi:multiple sugar transport system permease protein
MSHERGIISFADRKVSVVRYGLPAIQVLLFIGVVIAGVGPLLWLLKSGVSTSQDILRGPMQLWPSGIQLRNIPDAWNRVQIGAYLGNTAFIAIGSMIATLFVCTTGAFVLSILRPKWGPVVTGAVLATLFLPGVISLVPLYMTVLKMPLLGISLQNTFWAVWLPSAASAFNVLVMKRYFDSIPRELVEAARIDGASNLRLFTALILPLSKPIVGVVALLTVIGLEGLPLAVARAAGSTAAADLGRPAPGAEDHGDLPADERPVPRGPDTCGAVLVVPETVPARRRNGRRYQGLTSSSSVLTRIPTTTER